MARTPALGRLCLLACLAATGALLALWSPTRVCAQDSAQGEGAPPPLEDDRRFSDEILQRERELSSTIMSPFCPGRTLINCPSPDAHAYREVFKDRLASGVSESEIKRFFQGQFGDVTLGTPKGAFGWSIPALILAVGAGALAFALRRFRAAGAEAPEHSAAVSRELEAELERELQSRGL